MILNPHIENICNPISNKLNNFKLLHVLQIYKTY